MGKDKKRRKVPKVQKPRKNNVDLGREDQTLNPNGVVFDLSFEFLFWLINENKFFNKCMNEIHFIEATMSMHEIIYKLSGKSSNELFRNGGFRHCHKLENEQRKIAIEAITRAIIESGKTKNDAEEIADHLLGSENLYQAGYDKGARVIGTLEKDEVFRILLLDFHHQIFPDDKKNKLNEKRCVYSPMQKRTK